MRTAEYRFRLTHSLSVGDKVHVDKKTGVEEAPPKVRSRLSAIIPSPRGIPDPSRIPPCPALCPIADITGRSWGLLVLWLLFGFG